MKALSLWQPWASAVAVGSKVIETRSWSTSYRGPIAIHAAKRRSIDELIHFNACWNWQGALRKLGCSFGGKSLKELLPFGSIIAVAELVECRPTDTFTVAELDQVRYPEVDAGHLYAWTERQMGDFSPGRFGWVLSNIRQLETPVPFTGRQQLFNVPENLLSLT